MPFLCRCALIPILQSGKQQGITGIDEIPESTRASMEGQVTDTTFEDWLRRKTLKDPTFSDEILGKGRAKFWKDGVITLDQLIEGGKPLTLKELRLKYTAT
jgi:hypothetical protein